MEFDLRISSKLLLHVVLAFAQICCQKLMLSFISYDRYNLGSGAEVIRSAERIQPNEYHKVVAKRFQKEGTLRLDDGPEVRGTTQGHLTSLNLKTDVYLGYVPDMTPA